MTIQGYTFPLTPDGRAGLVPPPPWHYSADFTLIEYRTNPDNVIALLPPELDPADDPGAVAVLFAEWQSASGDMSELFWLNDDQMAKLEPIFPKSHGKPRVDDKRVLSGSEEDQKTIQ